MRPRYEDRSDIGGRWRLTCTLTLDTPAHFGGTDPDFTSDRPILVDPEGRPYIPGTTLKGVLRANGPGDSARLFGTSDEGQARLLCDDARAVGEPRRVVRDGVRIVPACGLADGKKKYDITVLEAGTQLLGSFELVLPKERQRRDRLLVTALATLALLDEGLSLGARTSRGYGRLHSSAWSVQRYRVQERADLLAWLGSAVEASPWRPVNTTHVDSIRQLPEAQNLVPQTREWTRLKLSLEIDGSVLVRGPPDDDGADCRHIHAWVGGKSEPVLPGTTLAGALRSRCLRIAQTLGAGPEQARELCANLFGAEGGADGPTASKVRVHEAVITGGRILRHTRVRIDPWTGGAAESLLFTGDVLFGGTVEPILEWQGLKRPSAELGLLALALRDLAAGDLAVGGDSSVGRGRFKPKGADGSFARIDGHELKLVGDAVSGAEIFDADVQQLRDRWRPA